MCVCVCGKDIFLTEYERTVLDEEAKGVLRNFPNLERAPLGNYLCLCNTPSLDMKTLCPVCMDKKVIYMQCSIVSRWFTL